MVPRSQPSLILYSYSSYCTSTAILQSHTSTVTSLLELTGNISLSREKSSGDFLLTWMGVVSYAKTETKTLHPYTRQLNDIFIGSHMCHSISIQRKLNCDPILPPPSPSYISSLPFVCHILSYPPIFSAIITFSSLSTIVSPLLSILILCPSLQTSNSLPANRVIGIFDYESVSHTL